MYPNYERQIEFVNFLKAINLKTFEDYKNWLKKKYIDEKLCAREIVEIQVKNGYNLSIRQLQRILGNIGITRTNAEAFRLEVKKGNVTYHKNPNHVKRVRVSDRLRMEIFKRDNFKCVICGATKDDDLLEIDHIVPVCEGGNNDPENLRTTCRRCNKGLFLTRNNGK